MILLLIWVISLVCFRIFLTFYFPFMSVLLKKVKKLESKELEKYKIDPLHLPDFDKLLDDVYIARRPTPTECFNRRDLIRIFNAIAKEIYGSFSPGWM